MKNKGKIFIKSSYGVLFLLAGVCFGLQVMGAGLVENGTACTPVKVAKTVRFDSVLDTDDTDDTDDQKMKRLSSRCYPPRVAPAPFGRRRRSRQRAKEACWSREEQQALQTAMQPTSVLLQEPESQEQFLGLPIEELNQFLEPALYLQRPPIEQPGQLEELDQFPEPASYLQRPPIEQRGQLEELNQFLEPASYLQRPPIEQRGQLEELNQFLEPALYLQRPPIEEFSQGDIKAKRVKAKVASVRVSERSVRSYCKQELAQGKLGGKNRGRRRWSL